MSYDQVGKDWLRPITYKFIDIEDIISRIRQANDYIDVDKNVLKTDLLEFYHHLFTFGFIDEIEDSTSQSSCCPDTKTFDDIQESDFAYPLNALVFELTNKCNERCIHCYIPNDIKDKAQFLPLKTFKKVIDEFTQMGGLFVRLTGGEIFEYPHLWDVLEYCKSKNLKVEILSNLIKFDPTYVDRIKNLGVVSVQVSLYSMSSKIHDGITLIPGSYARTRNAIEHLAAAGVDVIIGTPLMTQNIAEVLDILKYANSIGATLRVEQILLPKEDLTTDNLTYRVKLSETETFLREIALYDIGFYNKQIRKQFTNDDVPDFDFIKYLEQPVCGIAKDHLCIAPNGNITPCTGWQGLVLGNVKSDTLDDIWYSNIILRKLRNVREKDYKKCVSCDSSDYCIRCMKRSFNEFNGKHFEINPIYCEIAKLNKNTISKQMTINNFIIELEKLTQQNRDGSVRVSTILPPDIYNNKSEMFDFLDQMVSQRLIEPYARCQGPLVRITDTGIKYAITITQNEL